MGYVLKRSIPDTKSRNILSFLVAIVLAPIFYLTLVFFFFTTLFYEPQSDFNKEKWFTNKQERFEMRDDIMESEMLLGLKEKEVIKLVGQPDEFTLENQWKYHLGASAAGFGWQFNSLLVTYESGVVSKVEILKMVD